MSAREQDTDPPLHGTLPGLALPHWRWAPGSPNPSTPLHRSLLSTWSSEPPSPVETPSRSAPNLPSAPKAWPSGHRRVDLGPLPNPGGLAQRGLLQPRALFPGTPAICGFRLQDAGGAAGHRPSQGWRVPFSRRTCLFTTTQPPLPDFYLRAESSRRRVAFWTSS